MPARLSPGGGAIAWLLAEQLRLEEELAVLVEDVYELNDQERTLLHATRPIRDPLDVLRFELSGRFVSNEAAEIDREV